MKILVLFFVGRRQEGPGDAVEEEGEVNHCGAGVFVDVEFFYVNGGDAEDVAVGAVACGRGGADEGAGATVIDMPQSSLR